MEKFRRPLEYWKASVEKCLSTHGALLRASEKFRDAIETFLRTVEMFRGTSDRFPGGAMNFHDSLTPSPQSAEPFRASPECSKRWAEILHKAACAYSAPGIRENGRNRSLPMSL